METVVPEGTKATDYIDYLPHKLKIGPWGIFHPVKTILPLEAGSKEPKLPLAVVTLWRSGWSATQRAVLDYLQAEDFPEDVTFYWGVEPGSDTEAVLLTCGEEEAWGEKRIELVAIQMPTEQASKHAKVAALYNAVLEKIHAELIMLIEDDVVASIGTWASLRHIWSQLPPEAAACMVPYRSRTRPNFACAGDLEAGYVAWAQVDDGELLDPLLVPWVGGGYTLYDGQCLRSCLPLKCIDMGTWTKGWDVDACEKLQTGLKKVFLTMGLQADHRFAQ
jgi:hypothetical protein